MVTTHLSINNLQSISKYHLPIRKLAMVFVVSAIAGIGLFSSLKINNCKFNENCKLPNENSPTVGSAAVLGASSPTLNFNIPTIFNSTVDFGENVVMPNVLYSIKAGEGLSVSSGQTPTITNTGVLSLNGSTGALTLTAGSGISISGLAITNSDLGSSQNIFKTISVSGQSDIVSDTNSDTLTLAAGTGLTLSTDATNDKVTFTADTSAINVSGWTHSSGLIYTTTLTDLVGIGAAPVSSNLEVTGTQYVTGATTLGSTLGVTGNTTLQTLIANGNMTFGNTSSDSITFNARLANGTVISPINDLGADLGTALLRFNNLYVANLNSNNGMTTAGQAVFTYSPTLTTYTDASAIINPTSPVTNGLLLGIGTDGNQKAGIDAEGDLTLGYSGAVSAPISNYQLTIFNHGTTAVTTIDTSGNIVTSGSLDINGTTSDIAGALNLSGNSLTSSGALTITPASGQNLNISLSNSLFTVDSSQFTVNSTTGFTGIGTASASTLLDVAGLNGIDAIALTNSGTKVLGISYGTNNIAFDLASTDPTNLLTNPTFDSDLTSWTEVPSYTLNDQFTTARSAGAVNGTSAEPTGGTRTVVDTGSKLSITGGQLSFATGGGGTGNPGLWYPIVTRGAGKIVTGTFTPNGGGLDMGWDSDTTGTIDDAVAVSGTGLYIRTGGAAKLVGAVVQGTAYQGAVVMRTTGVYYYIKGGTYTNWTLVYISASGSANSYGGIEADDGTAVFTADNIRIPTATWLPTPLAYDTFTRADGAIGSSETTGPDSQTTPSLAWTGGAISTNKNVITPSLGSELVTNGGFDSDTAWTKGAGWTIGSGVASITANSGNLSQSISISDNIWYVWQAEYSNYVSGGSYLYLGNNYGNTGLAGNGTKVITGRRYSGTNVLVAGQSWSPLTSNVDNFSVKPLTLSSLFSSVSTSDADVIADANVTMTAGTQAGLVLNLNDTTTPTNFILVYHNGTQVIVDEAVAGVYTNKQTTTVTYSAGATLRAIREGTKLRVYYNNALVGAELTMTANTNTKHGLFSTYSGNSFDNFTLWPRGSGTTKFTDAPFEELTATRDTGTKYAGAASAKLVAGGVDGNYTQNYNVGNTNTYTLTAYANTGGTVTSSDLSLYYGTSTLTTSYSHVKGDWYKLQATLTGIASSQPVGVRVKAGKTVYVDNLLLSSGTGTATALYIDNQSTGVAGVDVQSTSTLHTGLSGNIGLVVKGVTSQTANLSEWQNSSGTVLTSIAPNGLFNATTGGLATYVKAGTISDSDFSTTPPNGTIAIDSTNGRIYFKNGGAWSWAAKTAGFQIPVEETEGLSNGDLLIPYVDKKISDGAIHGLYAKASDINNLLFASESARISNLEKKNNTFNNATVLGLSTFNDLIITGQLTINNLQFTNNTITAPNGLTINGKVDLMDGAIMISSEGNLDIKNGIVLGNNQIRGSETLKLGQTALTVTKAWSSVPTTIIVTPRFNSQVWVTDKSKNGFTINTNYSSTQNEVVDWIAIW